MSTACIRRFTLIAIAILAVMICRPLPSAAADIEHPIMQPERFTDHVGCDNCGMDRNMWARTRYDFSDSKGSHHTCSLFCLAAVAVKNGEEPKGVMVALYLEPAKMVPADEAYYVVGSSAAGTMTGNSKLAFASEADAASFVKERGGKVMRFAETLDLARQELSDSRRAGAHHGMKGMHQEGMKMNGTHHGEMH